MYYRIPEGHVPVKSKTLSQDAVERALRESGIEYLVFLPESPYELLLDHLIDDRTIRLIPVARESMGISICAGLTYGGKRAAWLASYKGFYNCIDSYLGVARQLRSSFLMLISESALAKDPNFKAHHPEGGFHSEALLQALRIPYYEVYNDAEASKICQAVNDTATASEPVAVVLRW